MLVWLLALNVYNIDVGPATIYWPEDGHCGSIKATGEKFKLTDGHIAHRTIRLNTSGVVCNLRTRRCTKTVVQDRGPWGQIIRCNKLPLCPKGRKIRWNKKCHWWRSGIKLRPGWKWRGNFDLTRPVAKAIGHKQFDVVIFIYSKMKSTGVI